MPRRQYIARSLASETRSVFLRQCSLRLSASSAAGAEIGRDKGGPCRAGQWQGFPDFGPRCMHASLAGVERGGCSVEPPHPGCCPLCLSGLPLLCLLSLSRGGDIHHPWIRFSAGIALVPAASQEPQRSLAPRASSSAFRSLAPRVSGAATEYVLCKVSALSKPSQVGPSQVEPSDVRSGEERSWCRFLVLYPVHIVRSTDNSPNRPTSYGPAGETRGASFGHAVDCSS